MKFSEYLVEYKRNAITQLEGTIFGFPSLNAGWKKRYADREITDEMLEQLSVHQGKSNKQQRRVRKKMIDKRQKIVKYETTGDQYLYMMKNPSGMLKIGISKDPIGRARKLSTASGVNVIVMCFWKVDKNARMIENKLHKRFSGDRLEGEWFKPDSFDVPTLEENMHSRDCGFERIYIADEANIFKFIPVYPWTKAA